MACANALAERLRGVEDKYEAAYRSVPLLETYLQQKNGANERGRHAVHQHRWGSPPRYEIERDTVPSAVHYQLDGSDVPVDDARGAMTGVWQNTQHVNHIRITGRLFADCVRTQLGSPQRA